MKQGCIVAILAGAFALAERSALATTIQADNTNYQAMLATLQPGDVLELAAGHYPQLALTGLNGTQAAWITVTGVAGGTATIIDADTSAGGPCCNTVEIVNSSFLAIENLTIDGHATGAFGVSAKGDTDNVVHDILIQGNSFIDTTGGSDPQQADGISTKTPTWGWIIRGNQINGVGTGLYLGNSDGSDPFVGGLIEDNLVENPVGYCMEIKFQNPRPSVSGMPTAPTTTIVRNNVFIKNDQPSPDGDRPNILVGGFPASGPGSTDRYEIYANLFDHNPRESLLQASGRVTIHDNIFVDAPATTAIALQDQDLPLEEAYVYNNTIYGVANGIVFGNSAPQGDGVAGNLVFSANPIAGPIADNRDNLVDTVANAGMYVNAPSTMLGQMDFYPLAGKCTGTPIDESKFASDTDYAFDFNGMSKGQFQYRGAYAGSGKNPGWLLGDGIKQVAALGDAGAPAADGGANDGAAALAQDGGSASESDAGAMSPSGTDGGSDAGGTSRGSGASSGCGCSTAGSPNAGVGVRVGGGLLVVLAGVRKRRRRAAVAHALARVSASSNARRPGPNTRAKRTPWSTT